MGNKENTEPIGYLDDNQLAALKAKHNEKYIHEVSSTDEDGQVHCSYVKKPNLDQLQLLADFARKEQEVQGLIKMFKACRVGGSEAVLNDSEMLLSASGATGEIFKNRESKVKKR